MTEENSKNMIKFKIAFPEGDSIVANIPNGAKLENVGFYVKKKAREEMKRQFNKHLYVKGKEFLFEFISVGDKTVFDFDDQRSLSEIFGTLSSVKLTIREKGISSDLKQGKGTLLNAKFKEQGLLGKEQLIGEDPDERERFENLERERIAKEKEKEKKAKEDALLKARLKIEQDKLDRMNKVWVERK